MSEDAVTARRAPVQGRSQETVQRVLAAASALLARGTTPEALTTAQIAAEAGLSVGAIYRFFPDKQAIVDAIAAARMEEFQSALGLRLMFALPDSPATLLATVIDAFAAYLSEHPELHTLAYGGPGGGRHISRGARDEQVSDFVREFLSETFGLVPDEGFAFRLRCAIEIGDRLIGFAFEHTGEERARVLAEAKRLLADYLFPA